jgi:cell division septum initiation protein DivIVA
MAFKVAIALQNELQKYEDYLIECFGFAGIKFVSEGKTNDHVDAVRNALPEAIANAEEVLENADSIILKAENDALQIIAQAKAQAQRLVAESQILRQVEIEAEQIRRSHYQECQAMRSQTEAEINQLRQKYKQEQEQVYKQEIADLQSLRQEVSDYSDRTLADLEKKLIDTTKVVQSGRKYIQQELKNRR